MFQLTQSLQVVFLYVAGRIERSLMLCVTRACRDIPYIVAVSSLLSEKDKKVF